MLKRKKDLPVNIVPNARGGTGEISIQPLLENDELQTGAKAFGKITLPVGSSIGYHQHVGDIEAYYILSGEATVKDDDLTYNVTAGDIIFTGDGHSHSIANNGAVEVEFIGLILKA
ncbi:MAG: cupin domain-containing protein [Negativicutes bacterium]|jgi:mannose-6-phosphate isomerase-like protein (cupin superfamily)